MIRKGSIIRITLPAILVDEPAEQVPSFDHARTVPIGGVRAPAGTPEPSPRCGLSFT